MKSAPLPVRRAEAHLDAGRIVLTIAAGHASEPPAFTAEIDAATALALAGMLEAAVHKLPVTGLPLFLHPTSNIEPQTSP